MSGNCIGPFHDAAAGSGPAAAETEKFMAAPSDDRVTMMTPADGFKPSRQEALSVPNGGL